MTQEMAPEQMVCACHDRPLLQCPILNPPLPQETEAVASESFLIPSATEETTMAKRATAAGNTFPEGKQVHRRTFTMEVREGLDQPAKDEATKELLDKLTEQDSIEDEKKEVASGYSDKLKTIGAEINELRLKITEGTPTDTEVEEIKDFKKNTVTIVRTDTRAVVEKRELTDEDRQLDLGGAEDPDSQEEANA